jgi:hypothetical protein
MVGTNPYLRPCSAFPAFDITVQGKAHPETRNMKIKWLLCVILAGCAFGFAKDKTEVRDVTGFLIKGDGVNEFLLTGTDGAPGRCGAAKYLSPSMWCIP